ncbi:RICIN domain-containing protein [Corallincola spongiicola]|uniref:Carbohydrate-binding protein n=1 Tax=Corallincola spongiicola TaxID=2520508 RepID=A0ABY1WUI3_9GAMM|nr:RICIN domain-containing protein [Corallincola spongiicola]TAA48408.1 carbohydrate-binding protein [Corallincola spongiicola]
MTLRTKLSLGVAMAISMTASFSVLAAAVSDANWRNLELRHSGMCVDLAGGNTANKAPFHQWTCSKENINQRIGFIDRGNGFYSLKIKQSGKCLEVKNADTHNGAEIQQWPCDANRLAQQFQLEDSSEAWFKLKNLVTNKCVDVYGALMSRGTKFHQWECLAEHPNQEFRFIYDTGNAGGSVQPEAPGNDLIKVEAENFVDYGGTFDDKQAAPVSTYSVAGQGAINYINSQDFVDYVVDVSRAGMYEVVFNAATNVAANSAIELLVNENSRWVSYAQVAVPKSGWDNFAELTAAAKVKLPAGKQKVRIHALGSNAWQWNLESFTFTWKSDVVTGPVDPVDPDTPVDVNEIAKSGYAAHNLDTYAVASLPVPARIAENQKWVEQTAQSDNFNYVFEAKNTLANFGPGNKWYNFYHNQWGGPGATYWQYDHVSVNGRELEIRASRNPSFSKMNAAGVNAGCITSNSRVVYPVFVETSVSLANISLASDVWLLSPDDTQEIDIIEAYGGVNYFEQFIHLSHHSFIRSPFTDYQPRDHNSWFGRNDVTSWGDYTWDNGNRKYVQVGVNWVSPKHFEYYIDGELVRVVYHNAFATKLKDGTWSYTQPYLDGNGNVAFNGGYQAVKLHGSDQAFSMTALQTASDTNNVSAIDPLGFQGGLGFTKPMDIIINIESQSWLVEDNSPSDSDLADPAKNTMKVDWIRVFKPVAK